MKRVQKSIKSLRPQMVYDATSDNSGHTAILCFAQIQPYGWTSDTRRMLSEIGLRGGFKNRFKKGGMII